MFGSMEDDTSSRTTSPKRRRAQLVLHRAQQVVGLVGDGEVGVARDPEDVVAQRSPFPGRARPGGARSRSRAARTCRRRSGTKRGSTSFGTFTRANISVPETGSRSQTAKRQRQVGDVRERPARARPPAASARGRSARRTGGRSPRSSSPSQPAQSITRIPCSRQLGADRLLPLARVALARARGRARRSARSSRPATARPGRGRRCRRRPGRAARPRAPCRTRRGWRRRSRGT